MCLGLRQPPRHPMTLLDGISSRPAGDTMALQSPAPRPGPWVPMFPFVLDGLSQFVEICLTHLLPVSLLSTPWPHYADCEPFSTSSRFYSSHRYNYIVSMCTCSCGCTHLFVDAHAHVCTYYVWRSEVSLGCHPSGAMHLTFRDWILTFPELTE